MNDNSGIPYNNAGNQQYTGAPASDQQFTGQQGVNSSQIPQSTDSGYQGNNYQNSGVNYGQQGTGYQDTGANQGQQGTGYQEGGANYGQQVGQDQSQVPQNQQYSTQDNVQGQQEHGQETLADKVEHMLEKFADKITGHGSTNSGAK